MTRSGSNGLGEGAYRGRRPAEAGLAHGYFLSAFQAASADGAVLADGAKAAEVSRTRQAAFAWTNMRQVEDRHTILDSGCTWLQCKGIP